MNTTVQNTFPWRAVLALLGAMLALAVGTSLAKQLFPVIGAEGTTLLRVGFSALVMLQIWRPWRRPLARQDAWHIARYGAALALMNLLFYMALRTIPFGIAVAIEFCGPLAVAVYSSRQRLDLVWVGLAIAGLLMLLPLPSSPAAALDPVGVLYAVGAAICWAAYIIYGRRTRHLHTGQVLSLGVTVGALVIAPVGLGHAGATLFTPEVLGLGLVVALISSATPTFLEMKALRQLRPETYGVMTSLEPAIAAVVAFVALDEHLTALQWGAIGCTMLAAMGSALTANRGPAPVPPEAHDT
ncbi:MAG: DMT family transporter [Lautropia sp.]|nr:DMT family transporter [Lautropia sp.]